jgi:hypothetical protein
MGSGRIYFDQSANRYFVDMTVRTSAFYDATDDENLWREAFTIASRYLFEATHGQAQIGKIRFIANGPGLGNADAVLIKSINNSSTQANYHRELDSQELVGAMTLTTVAMKFPMEIAHEIGHFALGLGDEYLLCGAGCSIPSCTRDATTGASLMEFSASKHGVGIEEDPDGNIVSISPLQSNVNQFCFPRTIDAAPHEHMRGVDNATNVQTTQQSQYPGKSCWEVICDGFSKMQQPQYSSSNSSSIQPISWEGSLKTNQFLIALFDFDSDDQENILNSLKPATLAFVNLIAGTGNEFALLKNLQVIRALEVVSTDSNLLRLVDNIKGIEEKSGAESSTFLGLDQFQNAKMAGNRRIIMIAPGDHDVSADSASEFLHSFSEQLEDNFIDLTVLTYGSGDLATALNELETQSPRLTHINYLPFASENYQSFHLQNALAKIYFSETPGLGIVSSKTGRFPTQSIRDVFDHPEEFSDPVDALLLHPQAEGVDHVVSIEEGAQAAYFVLSLADRDDAELILIRPNQEKLGVDSEKVVKSSLTKNVKFFEVQGTDIAGRWIVRVRRNVAANIKERKEIPFQILVAARNGSVNLSTKVQVKGNQVTFSAISTHEKPLDFVNTTVEIYQDEHHEQATGRPPIQTARLRRPVVTDRNGRQIEVSSGRMFAQTTLQPGNYFAVFECTNVGHAIHANNPKMHLVGFDGPIDQPRIPPFTRMQQRYFTVKGN